MAVYPVFPNRTRLGWPIIKTLELSREIQKATSGKEVVLSYWQMPIRHWTLDYGFLRNDSNHLSSGFSDTDSNTLEGFYMQQTAAATPFFFLDQDDNATVAAQFGVGDGTTTVFQLTRPMGGFNEWIQAPQTGTVTLFDNGSAISGGSYTLSATGVVTFTSAPANTHVLTWTGSYWWNVRFEEDSLDFEFFKFQLYRLKQVKLIQVKM